MADTTEIIKKITVTIVNIYALFIK